MGLTGAFLLFSMFIAIYIVIIEIFTVLFRLTGLTKEKARFQVISMLTNSGFTTEESEIITKAKKRRQLANATMIFGYSFSVIIVSSVVNIFFKLHGSELKSIQVTLVLLGIFSILLVLLVKNRFIKKKFDDMIEHVGAKLMFGENANAVVLLDTYGNMVIAQIHLSKMPEILNEKTVMESRLKEDYDILVMLLKHGGTETCMICADTIFKKNDVIVVFGPYKAIREVFENPQ